MSFSAKVIADSISPAGVRLTTLQLRYPRFIHSEFMTHRMFSRNASSSRAIPVSRLIDDVMNDTAIPIHWGMNQKGMQADEENYSLVLCGANKTETDRYGPYREREEAWKYARDRAIEMAQNFANADYHKQIVNRLLEPFSHINVVVTATEWENFFALRDHAAAQPEMRHLAKLIRQARDESEPIELGFGEWHLPYVSQKEYEELSFSRDPEIERKLEEIEIGPERGTPITKLCIRLSVARCARVSYMTHEGKKPTIEQDLALYDRLFAERHVSPAEHQGTPDVLLGKKIVGYDYNDPNKPVLEDQYKNEHLRGNFRGWIQYRKTFPGENVT